jgi:hypothetical protein
VAYDGVLSSGVLKSTSPECPHQEIRARSIYLLTIIPHCRKVQPDVSPTAPRLGVNGLGWMSHSQAVEMAQAKNQEMLWAADRGNCQVTCAQSQLLQKYLNISKCVLSCTDFFLCTEKEVSVLSSCSPLGSQDMWFSSSSFLLVHTRVPTIFSLFFSFQFW